MSSLQVRVDVFFSWFPRIHIHPLLLFHSTLGIYPAFEFPALPTLDGHFISQIKALCRESMIVSLVKTASDLEMYAREFEISCGNVEQLLRPTFDMYKLTPPQLPMPVPLTAYPLDFRAPEGNLFFAVRFFVLQSFFVTLVCSYPLQSLQM